MIRIIALALLLTACTATMPDGIEPTLAPAYALQDAQATGTAAARAIEGTATAQVNFIATEARASIALAELQTQAAIPGMQTATAISNAVLVATATEGAAHNATQIAATLAADDLKRERETFDANAWLAIQIAAIAPVVVLLCLAIARIGSALESKIKMASIVIIRNENAPVGYIMPGLAGRPRYHSLTGGHPLAIEAEPDLERQCRKAWQRAAHDVGSDAAQARSWSVNSLSRGGGRWAEDTVLRVQTIAEEVGALINYGGTRGWDWAGDWDLITFTDALDQGVFFTLPRKAPAPEGEPGPLCWPVFPEQSKAKLSKATQAKQTTERKLSHVN